VSGRDSLRDAELLDMPSVANFGGRKTTCNKPKDYPFSTETAVGTLHRELLLISNNLNQDSVLKIRNSELKHKSS